jgi:hypothetical protein
VAISVADQRKNQTNHATGKFGARMT